MKRGHRNRQYAARLALLTIGLPLSLAAGAQVQTQAQTQTQPQSQPQAQQPAPNKAKKARHKTRRKTATHTTPSTAQADAATAPVQMHAQHPDALVQPNAPERLASGSPDLSVNRAVEADNTKPAQSSQSQSKGFIADSHLTLNLRNYADHLDVQGGPHRHAWVQGAMLDYTSGYTQGPVGLGVDASLYAALKLDGGAGAGNMVHVGKDGGGSNQLAWAYPGIYDVKARISDTVVKYGLQMVSDNPFFEPHDNRALPPTFLGASLVSNDISNVALQAGSFTKVDPRGHTNLVDLSTTYGGVSFKRFSYLGGSWDYSKSGSLALFANQADDVWRQYYGSLQQSYGDPSTIKWTGFFNIYSTHNAGSALQGPINSNAYSLSLSAQHGPHSLFLGYQEVLGDQFFDYVNETAGIYLVNSMDVDYNAPHEQSFQVRYGFDGKYAGLPGAKAMLWYALGWGANATAGALANPTPASPLYNLYWKDGQPVHGSHHEFGLIPSYTVQDGRFKDTKFTFIAMWHHGSKYYSDPSNMEYRLVVNMPLKLF
ncbi:Outer membrane porin, OprD family [Paraburkholderia unamae]|uniref:OprD family outer membrane porin n=1 Tax=Paraburkholderia unamae TaxID=219649 RepID=UPI001CAF1CC7|nr:OprD family outer membrane porin [Paraburkholderia unamae]CAG9251375.1 Outer membrane porin, OprD family [Paraburkholderia unamae]